jgi:hypothetical protein
MFGYPTLTNSTEVGNAGGTREPPDDDPDERRDDGRYDKPYPPTEINRRGPVHVAIIADSKPSQLTTVPGKKGRSGSDSFDRLPGAQAGSLAEHAPAPDARGTRLLS